MDLAPRRRGFTSLPFGTFYGRVNCRWKAAGLDVAVLNADPNRVVERHSHDEAHFVLVLDGLYMSSAAGADAISSGTALIFNPAGTTHRDTFIARTRRVEGRFLTLSIAASLIEAPDAGLRLPSTATAIRDPGSIAIAQRIVRECLMHPTEHALERESLAVALLSAIGQPRDLQAATPPGWLTSAREQLDDRCGDNVTMAEVAQAAGVHPVHLARVFRRYLGCTPGEYLRQRRLERSRTLLRETTRPLAAIALSCGYTDQSHFANAFKRDTHQTPGAYRRRARDG
jgi:AraC family transcriptional regulator